MSSLNVNAAPFQPSAPVAIPQASGASYGLPEDPWALSETEVALSPAELEELETVEGWVQLMADLEESEADHCIALALRYGDRSKIQEIKARAAHKAAAKHGKPKGGVHKPKGQMMARAGSSGSA